jgi:methionyl-tRNA formyltransferase
MYTFCIIGSSTPLQKVLPYFFEFENAKVQYVFLDTTQDTETIKFCESKHIPYRSLNELKTPAGREFIKTLQFDYLFNINSTFIIPAEILQIANKANLNLHPGKLPEYAGMHTHQWAIRNNETSFGVTLHYMLEGIDIGPICLQQIFPISTQETGLGLFLKCLQEGSTLVKKAISIICRGEQLPSVPQDLEKRKLYTVKMAQNGEINWNLSALEICNFIRAANYAPFQSPTYHPFFKFNNAVFYCGKALVEEDQKLSPGSFKLIDKGLLCGTATSAIFIAKLKSENGEIINEKRLHEIFK